MTEPAIPRLRDYSVGDKVRIVDNDECISQLSSSKSIMAAIKKRTICTVLKKDPQHDIYLVEIPTTSNNKSKSMYYICSEELIPVTDEQQESKED